MRIICSMCPPGANVLGEKCFRCGNTDLLCVDRAPAITELGSDFALITIRSRYVCCPCRHLFTSGEGGDSHTLCPTHEAQARADAGLPLQEKP